MYLGLLRKRTTTFTTNTISAHRHRLFRGFSPGKCHAAQIASCDLGSAGFYLLSCIARTEAFLMASSVVYHRNPWARIDALSCICLVYCPSAPCLALVLQIRSVMVDPGFPWVCLISAWLGLTNGLNVPAARQMLFANPRRDCSGDRLYAGFQASFGCSFLLSYVVRQAQLRVGCSDLVVKTLIVVDRISLMLLKQNHYIIIDPI